MPEKKNVAFVTTRWVNPTDGETVIAADEDDVLWELKIERDSDDRAHFVLVNPEKHERRWRLF